MRKLMGVSVFLGMVILLGGCSSSKTNDIDMPTDELLPTEAGTDAIPSDSAEAPAPTDQAAAPSAEQPPPEEVAPTPPAEQPATAEKNTEPASTDTKTGAAAPGLASGPVENYTVQSGDTLMKIAFETYGDLYQWKKIYELNRDKISNPGNLSRGTVIKIEKTSSPVSIERNGEKYLIKLGDTLCKISDDVYGTRNKWRKLWENNRQLIKDPNRIFAGFYLYYTMSPDEKPQHENKAAPAPLLGGIDDAAARTPAQQ